MRDNMKDLRYNRCKVCKCVFPTFVNNTTCHWHRPQTTERLNTSKEDKQ